MLRIRLGEVDFSYLALCLCLGDKEEASQYLFFSNSNMVLLVPERPRLGQVSSIGCASQVRIEGQVCILYIIRSLLYDYGLANRLHAEHALRYTEFLPSNSQILRWLIIY